MDDKKYNYRIWVDGRLSSLGKPVHEGVLWAHDENAAHEAAWSIARMYGITRARVSVEEIRLEVVK